MRKRTKDERKVSNPHDGIEVQSGGDLSDAMSATHTIRITIPPMGVPGFTFTQLDEVLAAIRGDDIRFLRDARSLIENEASELPAKSNPYPARAFSRQPRLN